MAEHTRRQAPRDNGHPQCKLSELPRRLRLGMSGQREMDGHTHTHTPLKPAPLLYFLRQPGSITVHAAPPHRDLSTKSSKCQSSPLTRVGDSGSDAEGLGVITR